MWGVECVVVAGLGFCVFGAPCGAVVGVFSRGDGGECAADGRGDAGGGLEPVVDLSWCGNTEGGDGQSDDACSGVDDLPEVPGGAGDASVEVEFARMNVVNSRDVVLSHGVILYVMCGQE